jgi:hypothetical protein
MSQSNAQIDRGRGETRQATWATAPASRSASIGIVKLCSSASRIEDVI